MIIPVTGITSIINTIKMLSSDQTVEIVLISILLALCSLILVPVAVFFINIWYYITQVKKSTGVTLQDRIKNCPYNIRIFVLELGVNVLLVISYLRLMLQACIRIYTATIGSSTEIENHWSINIYSIIINIGIWLLCISTLLFTLKYVYISAVQIELNLSPDTVSNGKVQATIFALITIAFGIIGVFLFVILLGSIVVSIYYNFQGTIVTVAAIIYVLSMVIIALIICGSQMIWGFTACGLMFRVKSATGNFKRKRVIAIINIVIGVVAMLFLLIRLAVLLISSKILLDHIVVKMIGFVFEPISSTFLSLASCYPLYKILSEWSMRD